MKQQVVFINGAVPKENFTDYYAFLEMIEYNPYAEKFLNWNKTLGEKLGDEYEYLRTPSDGIDFADYEAWKIMFEKMIPYIREDVIMVTTSLGSTFILKYMGQNEFPVKIKKLFLLAAAIEDTPDEKLGSFEFNLEHAYVRVARWAKKIYIYHSQDDELVPYEQSLRLKQYFPEATFRDFYDKGHFYKEAELPELLEDIKN